MTTKQSILLSALAFILLPLPMVSHGQTTADLRTLYSFSALDSNYYNTDGTTPQAALVQGGDGNFYGTTYHGGYGNSGLYGTDSYGGVFKLTPSGDFSTIYLFNPGSGSDGANPSAALIQGRDGTLYGTSGGMEHFSGGSVYKVAPTGDFMNLYIFNDYTHTGGYPDGSLVEGSDGNFYGSTSGGGPNYVGTIFKITSAGVLTTLHSFSALDSSSHNLDGASPVGALIQGSDSNFYGTTEAGGANGTGTIFKMTPAGTLSVVHTFGALDATGNDADGASPMGALVRSGGDFFGTTTGGGANGTGTVFKLTAGGVLTTLHSFGPKDSTGQINRDGCFPGTLLHASDGNFYGVARAGGPNGNGTAFEITPAGVLTVLHSFSAIDRDLINADGAQPYDALIQASDGNLYGTASTGSAHGNGAVFELVVVPVISNGATAMGTVGAAFSYKINASHAATSYGVQGLPSGLTVDGSTGAISGTPKAAGTYPLTLHAYNGFGQGSASVTLTVASNAPPTITSARTATGKVGAAFNYQIAASHDPTSFGVQGLPSGLSVNVNTGLISGVPKTAATSPVTVNAYNRFGKGSTTVTVTIQTNMPPTITSPATASGKVNTAFAYQITANGNPSSYGAQGLPAGLTINSSTGLISGTPKGPGTLYVTLNAYNVAGKGSATLTLTIPGPPVITSATSANGGVGTAFSYQITATNAPTAFGVQGLPGGLTLDANTGLISGTLRGTGTSTLGLNAYNSAGKGTATLTLTITSN